MQKKMSVPSKKMRSILRPLNSAWSDKARQQGNSKNNPQNTLSSQSEMFF
jgi:hypothetical protein